MLRGVCIVGGWGLKWGHWERGWIRWWNTVYTKSISIVMYLEQKLGSTTEALTHLRVTVFNSVCGHNHVNVFLWIALRWIWALKYAVFYHRAERSSQEIVQIFSLRIFRATKPKECSESMKSMGTSEIIELQPVLLRKMTLKLTHVVVRCLLKLKARGAHRDRWGEFRFAQRTGWG